MKNKSTGRLVLECLVLFGFLIWICCATAGYQKRRHAQEPQMPDFVFTYAENQAEGYPTTQGALKFAELVEERTDGRIKILVKYGAELGDESSIIEQMRFGGVDFARVSLSPLAGVAPQLNVLQLPFLYKDSEHMIRVLDSPIGDTLMKSLNGTGLVALSWYDAGARSFYTTQKPIEKLEDMRGMRIRVQESELMEAMIEALGGYAVPMPFEEVYSALQTGKIDGAENNWPSYESERHYEVAQYYTVDEHARIPEVQLVSQVTWDKLTQEDQLIIRECARTSAIYERSLWHWRTDESMERVKNEDCVITYMPDTEKERFQQTLRPVYEKFCSEYMDIIEEIEARAK